MEEKIDQLIIAGHKNVQISEMLGVPVSKVKYRRKIMNVQNCNKRTCVACGAEFIEQRKGRHKQFCSKQCRFDYWNQKKMEQEYKLTCLNCGETFISKGNPNKRYCSRRCYCEQVKKNHEKENR